MFPSGRPESRPAGRSIKPGSRWPFLLSARNIVYLNSVCSASFFRRGPALVSPECRTAERLFENPPPATDIPDCNVALSETCLDNRHTFDLLGCERCKLYCAEVWPGNRFAQGRISPSGFRLGKRLSTSSRTLQIEAMAPNPQADLAGRSNRTSLSRVSLLRRCVFFKPSEQG